MTRVEDVGTLLYNSPEILENSQGKGSGGYDCRTDIWSFGCILYQLCNFDAPFNALTELKLVNKIKLSNHKQIDIDFPQDFKDLYEVCMNKNYLTDPTIDTDAIITILQDNDSN